ncbi:class I SAM-dependent methyltransferase [Alkalibacter mobilis]|uniref:class I SAM-dependent methyltransferase n=1 Tax=Alkalibacter mobilis TaxID=2787712 RepID=UPI00189EC9AD|nr:class I SAM-dependent methyltransferase [Alkalibacter mobilis]MBF7095705.1 class I SAM-dependent methyltransferase [Alkalibacter mobilis]
MDSIEYYNKNAKEYIISTAGLKMDELLNKFAGYIDQGGTVLDIGCGSGRDSMWFKKRGFDVWAHDGSIAMVEHCKIFLHDRVQVASFNDYTSNMEFDGLWACSSLLHVPRSKLKSIIDKYTSLLKKNGVFFMSFKLGEDDHEDSGRAFTNMSKSLIVELLDSCNQLKIVELIISTDQRTERREESWISVIAKKHED